MNTDLRNRRGNTVLGQRIQHSYAEIAFIDQVLTEQTFKTLIEFGTAKGGLSLLLGLHALRVGGHAYTFDISGEPLQDLYAKLKPLIPLTFLRMDVLSDEAVKLVSKLIILGRTMIYCDAQKIKEFNLYAPLLKKGDVIMAHDKGTIEIRYADIVKTVNRIGLKPFHQDAADKMGTIIFSFIKEEAL